MGLDTILINGSGDSSQFACHLKELAYRGALEQELYEIKPCYGFNQCNQHHAYDVFDHTISALSNITNSYVYTTKMGLPTNYNEYSFLLRVALLFHDIGKPNCFAMKDGKGTFYGHDKQSEKISKPILQRLNLYAGIYDETILLLIRKHMDLLRLFTAKDATIRKFMKAVGIENIPYFLGMTYCDLMGGGIPAVMQENIVSLTTLATRLTTLASESNKQPKLPELCIAGRDIANLGFKGREIGQMLRLLAENVQTASLSNDRSSLLNFALHYRDSK